MSVVYNPIQEWLGNLLWRKSVAGLGRLLVTALPGEPTASILRRVEWILPFNKPDFFDVISWQDLVASTDRGRRITAKVIRAHELWARWQDECLRNEVTRVTQVYVGALETKFLEESSCRTLEDQIDTLVITLESKVAGDSGGSAGPSGDGGSA